MSVSAGDSGPGTRRPSRLPVSGLLALILVFVASSVALAHQQDGRTAGAPVVHALGASMVNFVPTVWTSNPTVQLLVTTFENDAGQSASFNRAGAVDRNNPFFRSLGTNGRTCESCHQEGNGWSISPESIHARFDASNGTDPLFRTDDGSNSPLADVSTPDARRRAYSMLLTKGLIRIGLPIPAGAEFTLVGVDDPYGFASATELSLFRRPLPSANLAFLTDVMWDGRETVQGRAVTSDLITQATDAITGHAQATTAPSRDQLQQIVNFETGLFVAQAVSNGAGGLTEAGAHGGPEALSLQDFFPGINNPFAGRRNATFNRNVFTMFQAWENIPGRNPSATGQARASIGRGEQIFNNRPFTISGVAGLNDVLGQPAIQGACSTCHNAPNSGSHSVSMLMDTGLTTPQLRTPDMPLYTLRCTATGRVIQTTDPGQALITGKCADINKFKVPVLRGIEARSPYFHNGMFNEINDLVNFYNTRFTIGLSPREMADLAAFIESL